MYYENEYTSHVDLIKLLSTMLTTLSASLAYSALLNTRPDEGIQSLNYSDLRFQIEPSKHKIPASTIRIHNNKSNL